ncbi:ricin-type beta-trefoil lectin domain protein [Kitasatospora atroaurantiaca]|uniref:galactosylceramidase n=1 Tax=Kitasatospora atroaurantiaca TaxID=285545 RepID=A0A561EI18_9ACTN|nr:RICIN domain-containing protein [Kitasatospora atroaurantiaca]TWE15258.1 O-glycosyl hydrolase [Kitasatospora atroaurantiaca]
MTWTSRHHLSVPTVLVLLLGALFGLADAHPAVAATSTSITVDGASPGRTFDGIGAISGGGGNTRLLRDYPAAQQSQILDYLFKPGYGADLQILKVEVGGDTNSTDGAEASIEHTRGTIDCNAGYEWWLMEQAQARNPAIKFAGLSWGAPGWIGNGSFYSQDMIDYLVSWLGCAKQHGLSISYLGGWNERDYNATWYENLKSALTGNGYTSTKLVAGDNFGWSVATAMRSDSKLNAAVDVVGSHYPCGYLSAMTTCSSSADAIATGKTLWASENGSEDAETGAPAVARAINRGYIDGRMTAYVNWPVVASLYQNLEFSSDGLITANQPWSGAYTVGRTTWSIAQTTQFTSPGWKYLDTATGYLGGSRGNGSYVSYAAPDRGSWSTVLETMDATASQTVSLSVAGGLPGGTLHVWSTDLSSPGTATPRMVRGADLTATNGTYQLTLAPGRVYTVTTTTGQGAGSATSPQRSRLALPYADSFAGYGAGQEATYFSTMNGAFEAASCGGGRSGSCLRQMAQTTPIRWTGESSTQPYTLMGDLSWSDYTVSSDVLLENSGSAAEILGRVTTQTKNNGGLNAYHLRLSDTGAWSLLKSDGSWTWTTLAGGTVSAPGKGTWHNLALTFQGTSITARIDGTTVGTVTDGSYGGGQIGLGTAGYYPVQYSNLSITPGTAVDLSGTYKLVNARSGMLLDAFGGATADGTPIIQWSANGGANQQWTLARNSAGYYTITGLASGKVLDVPNATTSPGTQLKLWTANGDANQQWLVAPAANGTYTIEARSNGYKAEVVGASTSQGAAVDQWPTNGGGNQQWQLVKVG